MLSQRRRNKMGFGDKYVKETVPTGWNLCEIVDMKHVIKENGTEFFQLTEAKVLEGEHEGKKIMYNTLQFMYKIYFKNSQNLVTKATVTQNTYGFFKMLGLISLDFGD